MQIEDWKNADQGKQILIDPGTNFYIVLCKKLDCNHSDTEIVSGSTCTGVLYWRKSQETIQPKFSWCECGYTGKTIS